MPAKKESKTLNEKITDLDNKVEWFYGDDFKLEEATDKYKDTLTLAKEIETDLNNLKNEIEVLSEDFTKQSNQCYNKLMDNMNQAFPMPGQPMPTGGNGMQNNYGMQSVPMQGLNQPQMPANNAVLADDKSDLFKTIAIVGLAVIALALGVLFALKLKDYNDIKSDMEGQIAIATADAVDENTTKLEAEFAEREKSPTRSFTGPEDYGALSFDYPKTWSLYVSADASKGGDYIAFFNPIQIDSVSDKASLFALRLSITTKSFETVVAAYQSQMESKNANLSMDTITINDTVANRYTGTIPGTEFNGYIVIIKIRDKTAVLQTDSYLFESDFDKLLETIKFNS